MGDYPVPARAFPPLLGTGVVVVVAVVGLAAAAAAAAVSVQFSLFAPLRGLLLLCVVFLFASALLPKDEPLFYFRMKIVLISTSKSV